MPKPPSATGRRAPLYRPLRAVLSLIMRLLWRVRVENGERLPQDGPAILAPNHRSFIDSLFLPLVVPRQVTFVAKAEYFDKRRTRWFFQGTGQIPLRRGSAKAAGSALDEAAQALERGEVVAVYPEGTRSRDGLLHRGHTGPARLAASTGAPVVPVGLVGTDAVQPPGALVPRPFRTVTVRFGRPRTVDGGGDDKNALRQATDNLMQEIADLTGQKPAPNARVEEPSGAR